MSRNKDYLEQQLDDKVISDLGCVALAIENLSERLEIIAYGRTEYPGALEKIGMELKNGADALGMVASAIEEKD